MYIVPKWGELPHLVLTRIYALLDKQDRLNASSTCWHWRSCLFQPKFFKKVTFQVSREKEAESAFYLGSVALFCNSIEVCFNPNSVFGAQQAAEILQKIRMNTCAQRLILRPKYPSILLLQYRNFLAMIQFFLSQRKFPLLTLDLGGMESMADHAMELLKTINHANQVQSLGLATVKSQPNYYLSNTIAPNIFEGFQNLRQLSIDYDHISDGMLDVFEKLRGLRKIILHVHSVDMSKPQMSDEAWRRLTSKNSSLRLHLVLIYAYDAVYELQDLLLPAMPLSHLKVLFCDHLNTTAIERLSSYSSTLESLVWVDVTSDILDYFEDYEQDPLVMMAWRCKKLKELVLNGYELDPMNVIGIARLRGEDLHRFEVSNVSWDPELCAEVSKQVGRDWVTLPKSPLNVVFVNEGRFNLQLQNEYVMKCVQNEFDAIE